MYSIVLREEWEGKGRETIGPIRSFLIWTKDYWHFILLVIINNKD